MKAISIYTYTDIVHFSPFIKEYPNDIYIFVIKNYYGQKRNQKKHIIYFSPYEFKYIKKYFTETLKSTKYKEFENFDQCKKFCLKNNCQHFLNSGRDFEQGKISKYHHLFSRVNEGISWNLINNFFKNKIFNETNMKIYSYGPEWYNEEMQEMYPESFLNYYNSISYVQEQYMQRINYSHPLYDPKKLTILVPIRQIYLPLEEYSSYSIKLLTDLGKFKDKYNIIVRMRPGVTYSVRNPYDQFYYKLTKKCNKYGFIIDNTIFSWPTRQSVLANIADAVISPTVCGLINETLVAEKPYISMLDPQHHKWPNTTKFISYDNAVNNDLVLNYNKIDLNRIEDIKYSESQKILLKIWKESFFKYVDIKNIINNMK